MKYQEYPKQQQIDTFNQLLDDGWSVTFAMSKSKISGAQYSNFIKESKEARDRIAHYKKAKLEGRKYSYAGVPLTLNQLKEAGLEDEYNNQKRRKEYEERTKIEMQRMLEFRLKQKSDKLPRGI